MDVSLILVDYGRDADLVACLNSLARARPALKFEIILVGPPASQQRHRRELAVRDLPGIAVAGPSRFGMARTRNAGLAVARGQYVMMVDTDSDVGSGAVETLAAFLLSHPRVGLVAPRIVGKDGVMQFNCRRFLTVRVLLLRLLFGTRGSRAYDAYIMRSWAHDRPLRVDWVCGGHTMVRRAILQRLGPLDKRYRFGFEDMDWGYRAMRLGWEAWYVPGACCVHHGGPHHQGLNLQTMQMAISVAYFMIKHRPWAAPEGALPGGEVESVSVERR